ncbi:MAG: class III poly(R)-hydroxyalkanoic acid synthase subunit PhaE [Gomphosphaeria aponina SAG 52.96 = DSM 107014]|uniref:Poly(3-hydroxyalkanoate) polymerase subunit PhaE n=1 Tax=Gomphosphaeria aponina SAG 52.96 = DSM 107014 TaxID=1521640 RepID=A0A941JSN4_9CHRO|nr:class III poly(R)-hydroxyalkanoic acid synthase subunit PhaE [Gomphosphaeria aponina SAG 52.96 = DSM 107014]
MEKEPSSSSEMTNHLIDTWVQTGIEIQKSWFDQMCILQTGEMIEDVWRLEEHQEILSRFLKLSFKAGKEILPNFEAGEGWQQVMSKYTEQMRERLREFSARTSQTTQDTAQLWQLYMKETQELSQNWTTAMESFFKLMSKTGKGTAAPWIELNNLYWNLLYGKTPLMQSPRLGLNRDFHGKALRAFEAWTNLYRASLNYQLVLGEVQIRAFEQLIAELVALAEKGEKVQDWQQFQRLWSRVADEVFEVELAAENNLKIRGHFLNALNTYRLCGQELMELWLKTMNLPLRSEVDEVHQNIYHLRKEVKMLKQALAKYEAQEQLTLELFKEVQSLKQVIVQSEVSPN